MNYNENDTNIQDSDAGAGFVFILIMIAVAYYFFYEQEPVQKDEYVTFLENRIENLNSNLDYYNSLKYKAVDKCEDFASDLHNRGHFNVYHSTYHGTHSLWDLNKHTGSNKLEPLRSCSLKKVNLDTQGKANNLLMLCDTGGGGWTTNRVLASCAVDEEFNPSKLNVLDRSFHIMEGTGTGGPGNFAGKMVSGKVKFEVYKNSFINNVNQESFGKELDGMKSMKELVTEVKSKISSSKINLKISQDYLDKVGR
jgi:hypothetical protein